MKRKIVTIIIILAVAIVVGIGSVMAYNAVMTNRTGLTLNLDFGNNDGLATPTVYDTSGNGNNATAANAQTCTDDYCTFAGAGYDYMTTTLSAMDNATNVSFAIKFTPTWEANDGALHGFFSTGASLELGIFKANTNVLYVIFPATYVAIISPENYTSYWNANEENIIVFSGTSGNNKVWLNGNALINNRVAEAWTQTTFPTLEIGRYNAGSYYFDGNINYLKMWNRLLTDAEVASLSADRTKHVQSATRNGLIGHWNMDSNDISGTTVYDKSGNGNNGTMEHTQQQ